MVHLHMYHVCNVQLHMYTYHVFAYVHYDVTTYIYAYLRMHACYMYARTLVRTYTCMCVRAVRTHARTNIRTCVST